MRNTALVLFAVLCLGLLGPVQAKQKGTYCGGATWPPANDIKCIEVGGTISCVSNTIMCCKRNSQGGRTCSDDPGDLARKLKNLGVKANNPGAKATAPANPATPATPGGMVPKAGAVAPKGAPAAK